MKTVPISEFKAKCIALLRQAQSTGEPVLVTRRGVPLARVEPLTENTKERPLGLFRGRMEILGDIVDSAFEDDWEELA